MAPTTITADPIETLNDALNAALLCGDFMATADPRAWIKADNRLLDSCIAAGMDRDDAGHRGWAAQTITTWLTTFDDYCDCGATIPHGAGLCDFCAGEYRAEAFHMAEAA